MTDNQKPAPGPTEFQRWEQTILAKALKHNPERKESFPNSSMKDVPRVAVPEDTDSGKKFMESVSFPGQYPFTRGVQPTMYRGRFWTMRQYAGFGTAEESNARYRYLLGQGQTGLSVAFDLPTQIGYDSDHPMSKGEVGRVGVAIDTLDDMEILFDQIPLETVSTSMTINSTACILLAMYCAVAEKRGISPAVLQGTVQNDVLKEYIARGTYIFPPGPSLRLVTDIFDYTTREMPKWNSISISGYHIREAGSTAVQEVGFTLADAIAYVDAALARNLDLDSFSSRLSFFFNAHNNLLEEVAKFRAARRLWAKIMKTRFHSDSPKSQMMRFHCQTAGSTLTAQQPDCNVIRVTIQALAAVLGGAQSLHTNSKDEALALPAEDSVRLALRTQQVIAYESGIADSIDPLAGSYLIEQMTDFIEEKAMELIQHIDDMGGMVKAIENGFVQRSIQESAYQSQKRVESGQDIVVGMNKFQLKQEDSNISLLRVDPALESAQVNRLQKVKASRDKDTVDESLTQLKNAAMGTENVMPHVIRAVKNHVSLGEISDVFRSVFGIYQERISI